MAIHESSDEEMMQFQGAVRDSYRASKADPPLRERTMQRTGPDEQKSHGPMTLDKGLPTLAAASAKRTVEHVRIYGADFRGARKIPAMDNLGICPTPLQERAFSWPRKQA
jgi:hypothetical protein